MPVATRLQAGTLAPALFVQPHFDDVALSCGAAATQMPAGAATIVTVFGSDIVEGMVGPFAAWKHQRWGLQDVDRTIATRRAEDAAAAAALRCPAVALSFPDAIYRGDRYESDSHLFGALHDEEADFPAILAEELANLPQWRPGMTVFVPLGIGSHVDHQVAFEAGRRLAAEGAQVFAYEDCPYAIHTPAGLELRLDEIGGQVGEPVLVPADAHAVERKVEAIACYRSQVPVLFRFTTDWQAEVRAFMQERAADAAGEVSFAERFWPVLAP